MSNQSFIQTGVRIIDSKDGLTEWIATISYVRCPRKVVLLIMTHVKVSLDDLKMSFLWWIVDRCVHWKLYWTVGRVSWIVLILLSLVQHFVGESKKMYVYSMIVTSIFAIHSVLDFFKVNLNAIDLVLGIFPLHENGLGWVVPTLIVAILGYLLDYKKGSIFKENSST